MTTVPLPEPDRVISNYPLDGSRIFYYSEVTMQAYGAACRAAAIDEIAELINRSDLKGLQSDQRLLMYTAKLLSDIVLNIRGLK
jgi:hypothetical protein